MLTKGHKKQWNTKAHDAVENDAPPFIDVIKADAPI
jgi:hypothetical protein